MAGILPASAGEYGLTRGGLLAKLLGGFASGGLLGAGKAAGLQPPAWLDAPNAMLQNPDFNAAMGMAAPVGVYAGIRDAVRKAYLNVTEGRLNQPVALTDIRGQLKDIPRAELEDALKKMHLEEGTTLTGMDNPKDITDGLREGALNAYGGPKYTFSSQNKMSLLPFGEYRPDVADYEGAHTKNLLNVLPRGDDGRLWCWRCRKIRRVPPEPSGEVRFPLRAIA